VQGLLQDALGLDRKRPCLSACATAITGRKGPLKTQRVETACPACYNKKRLFVYSGSTKTQGNRPLLFPAKGIAKNAHAV